VGKVNVFEFNVHPNPDAPMVKELAMFVKIVAAVAGVLVSITWVFTVGVSADVVTINVVPTVAAPFMTHVDDDEPMTKEVTPVWKSDTVPVGYDKRLQINPLPPVVIDVTPVCKILPAMLRACESVETPETVIVPPTETLPADTKLLIKLVQDFSLLHNFDLVKHAINAA